VDGHKKSLLFPIGFCNSVGSSGAKKGHGCNLRNRITTVSAPGIHFYFGGKTIDMLPKRNAKEEDGPLLPKEVLDEFVQYLIMLRRNEALAKAEQAQRTLEVVQPITKSNRPWTRHKPQYP
jgi:hypothetical protein